MLISSLSQRRDTWDYDGHACACSKKHLHKYVHVDKWEGATLMGVYVHCGWKFFVVCDEDKPTRLIATFHRRISEVVVYDRYGKTTYGLDWCYTMRKPQCYFAIVSQIRSLIDCLARNSSADKESFMTQMHEHSKISVIWAAWPSHKRANYYLESQWARDLFFSFSHLISHHHISIEDNYRFEFRGS